MPRPSSTRRASDEHATPAPWPTTGGKPDRPSGQQRPESRGPRDLERPPLPHSTVDAWERLRSSGQLVNPSLLFDRYAVLGAVRDNGSRPALRVEHLKAVQVAMRSLAAQELARAYQARWRAMVRAAGAEPFTLPLRARLVTGLGSGGPLEIGFRFDRLGFPILPGSGVKGVARAYAELVEKRDESDPDFLAVFGRTPKKGESQDVAQAGQLVFFDAIPIEGLELALDVMTPHYPDYYQGKEPWPTPWQNPVPITFLTVAPGTTFAFAVGLRQGVTDPQRRLRALAETWLRQGLAELGFGAKTTSGYGRFVADGGRGS
uniref:Type III-B CRISPR module RAMP protein Cmr6 n=2 Tax=Thermorudis TaxID=1649508 RepID=A0A7C2WB43_9BACT